jgi:hypothetical protein
MKLRLYSDLHNEFDVFDIPELPDDKDTVLLLAGDIGVGESPGTYCEFLCETSERFKAVVYVPGNHEYYGGDLATTWDYMHNEIHTHSHRYYKSRLGNLHMLNDTTVFIDDTLFIGATLWTDFKLANEDAMDVARRYMNDFRRIKDRGKYFTTDQWLNEHRASRNYIFDALTNNSLDQEYNTVVVTHHGPSYKSTHYKYKGDMLNHCYNSDLEERIINAGPNLWVHGHIHNSMNYTVGSTRVVANPRGYHSPSMGYTPENKEFDETGVIESWENDTLSQTPTSDTPTSSTCQEESKTSSDST